MTEWILLVAFWVGAAPSEGNMNMTYQPGFRSKAVCEETARVLGAKLAEAGATSAFTCQTLVRT